MVAGKAAKGVIKRKYHLMEQLKILKMDLKIIYLSKVIILDTCFDLQH